MKPKIRETRCAETTIYHGKKQVEKQKVEQVRAEEEESGKVVGLVSRGGCLSYQNDDRL